MPADRLVMVVIDRARFQQRLGSAEHVFHHPQLFVLQRHALGRHLAQVRLQDPLAVKSRLAFHFRFVDGELLTVVPQILAVSFVAHHRLCVLYDLFTQR